MATGTVERSGEIPGVRGGFFVLNVDSGEELLNLVRDGREVFSVSFDPIVSMETLVSSSRPTHLFNSSNIEMIGQLPCVT